MPADQAPLPPLPFRAGDYIHFGRFKNKAGKLTRIWRDNGVVKIEIDPIPKGRKKSRIRNLFSIRLMKPEDIQKAKGIEVEEARKKKTAELLALKVAARFECDNLPDYLAGYAKRHPNLARQLPKVVAKSGSGSGTHGEARQFGDEIWIYPKFWLLDTKTRDWVMTHELGHYVLSRRSTQWLIDAAAKSGVDVWDSNSLPYGQFNMEEAFADCFAASFLERSELKSRYPQWVQIVGAV